ncbi:hypothetical protein LZA40_002299 [Listeria monocytogenes]|nr:hypothetical protein [Listeria monocytogenes]
MKVYEGDKAFQRATTTGWKTVVGTQINLLGIDFAFCPRYRNSQFAIDVFEVESGALVVSVPYTAADVYANNTRDKAVEFYKNEIVGVVLSTFGKGDIKKNEERNRVRKKICDK